MNRLAFTLIELLVVTVLVAIAAGVVFLRFDSISDRSRLRTAAREIGSIYRFVQTQCMTTGKPAMIGYFADGQITVHRPTIDQGHVEWKGGQGFTIPNGVAITRYADQGTLSQKRLLANGTGPIGTLVIRPNGVGRSHALDLSIGKERSSIVVLIEGFTGDERILEEAGDGAKVDLVTEITNLDATTFRIDLN